MNPAFSTALIGVFICTFGPSCRTFGDEFEAVRERIRTYVEEDGIPSVAVAAVRGSDVVWLEAFGWADVENGVAATPNTRYMLASTSKPITSTAVSLGDQLSARLNVSFRQSCEARKMLAFVRVPIRFM